MPITNTEYCQVLSNVRAVILDARCKPEPETNRGRILVYWSIGKAMNVRISWGDKFIPSLARDIQAEFPGEKGYSARNLGYMRKFATLFPEVDVMQAPLSDLSWYHHQALMDKTADLARYIWYAEQTAENGWTRDDLVHLIETGLFERQAARARAIIERKHRHRNRANSFTTP
ncbi:MAG: DUF1016 N-terminal domain-containing protein [Methylobacteriaceae bacterium]|jgi:predicted nuclease of restriction endonuclease-like (RecB) superfamily|nr:DUF1016 N-terminal domain-containing protein [Methylobacteriaceae bacterium]